MTDVIYILVLVALIIHECYWRPKVCNKKIQSHIRKIGGEVVDIESLSWRESIYKVQYRIGDKIENSVVKFDFIYEQEWR
ncbi:hypothetical protein [Clostridium ganghwense]|uniref:Uncharacterized protein n=1 Tax=Clostridium ganghwense TaxID=312089 RepID=A0ABT4CT13_9CLOT|nr:hypothetical protein [Clostridium ganghwense]MCY6372207.1 hypothetical protein [Clostridium ganghwense]